MEINEYWKQFLPIDKFYYSILAGVFLIIGVIALILNLMVLLYLKKYLENFYISQS